MTRRQGVDVAHPARRAIECVQLDAFWIRGPISGRTSGRPEAKDSAKYLGWALTMEVEVFACAVCCVLFAVVRPLGEEEGVWVKGRARGEQSRDRAFCCGWESAEATYGHGPQARLRLAGSQCNCTLACSVSCPSSPVAPQSLAVPASRA
jgi:hypothetical protein